MKWTSEQFDALVELVDAKVALANYKTSEGDYYGPLSESARVSEAQGRLRDLLVEEDETPEPVEERRTWRADVPPDCFYRFGVVDQHGTWWADKHGNVWSVMSLKAAKRKARELNNYG